jgi:lipid II:glycine glycyltransferase (peptidoglycan interpeptide bridge formation enzyme)
LSAALQSWNDATSVYGYPGPVTSVDKTDTGFLNRFNAALLQSFQELQIIAAFTRLHPVIQNETMLQQIGEISERGLTISIDLSQPEETQRKRYRKGHKYDIKKARQAGVVAYHDKRWNHYDDFLRMYTMTMQRVEARDSYYFDRAYFDMLREALGSIIHLFVAEYEGKIISAALFTFLRGIVQYHLSGSDTNFLRYQGSKVVLDEVRLWASSQGAKVLHLGGGVGSDQDNLFLFKSGFSDKRHVFKIWKCIVNQKMHEQAVTERAEYHGVPYPTVISKPFFPVYRAFD